MLNIILEKVKTIKQMRIAHNIFQKTNKIDFLEFVKKWGNSAIYLVKGKTVVGFVLITPRNEIGYFILAKYQKKGYGRMAVMLLAEKEPRKYYWVVISKKTLHPSLEFARSLGFRESGKVLAVDRELLGKY